VVGGSIYLAAYLEGGHSQIRCGLATSFSGCLLGHQLLAEAIGGKVAPARIPEIGLLAVDKTPQGNQDRMLQNITNPILALQWHGAEVVALPPRC